MWRFVHVLGKEIPIGFKKVKYDSNMKKSTIENSQSLEIEGNLPLQSSKLPDRLLMLAPGFSLLL